MKKMKKRCVDCRALRNVDTEAPKRAFRLIQNDNRTRNDTTKKKKKIIQNNE